MSAIIPKSSLKKWAQRKLLEGGSTVELIAAAVDPRDKVAIALVALLEVEPSARYAGMCVDEVHYVKSCHSYLASLTVEAETQALGAGKEEPGSMCS